MTNILLTKTTTTHNITLSGIILSTLSSYCFAQKIQFQNSYLFTHQALSIQEGAGDGKTLIKFFGIAAT